MVSAKIENNSLGRAKRKVEETLFIKMVQEVFVGEADVGDENHLLDNHRP